MASSRRIKSVAVIGAGAAGLAVARRLMDVFEVVVFEKASRAGGTWDFTAEQSSDVHSSMYKDMHTNLPKQIMAFPGFPFTQGKESFPHHTDVQAYLEAFAEHFHINDITKYNTVVDRITFSGSDTAAAPRPAGHSQHEGAVVDDASTKAQEAQGEHVQPGPWSVTSTNLKSGSTETRLFDAVCVCNGHYAKPIIPRLPGLDGFKGELLHSHTYRERAPFASKRVVCLGGGQSGRDISQELCTVSSRVVLSHRVPRRLGEDPLIEKPPITAIHEDGTSVEFEDGSVEENIDAIIMCTGYEFTFPFLDPTCRVTVSEDGRNVHNLYMQVFNMDHPSMAFIGLPVKVLPFPLFDIQCKWVQRVWAHEAALPSTPAMREEMRAAETALRAEGIPEKYNHVLAERQWAYNDAVASRAGVPSMEPWRVEMYLKTGELRVQMPWHYKLTAFDLRDDGTWTVKPYDRSQDAS